MSELREAFREAARREFAMVPAESELDYVFSNQFERRMRRMIRAQAHGYWNLINTTAKRVTIAAAIILMLLSTAMAIKPIRERVIKFFVDVYEEYFEIHFGEEESWDLPERTEPMVRYTVTELPDGYDEVEFMELEHVLRTEWRNAQESKIILIQEAGTHEIVVDNKMVLKSIQYNDYSIAYQTEKDTTTYIWERDGYIFYLTAYEEWGMEAVLDMIVSIKEKE